MLAITFSENKIRLINPTNTRLGRKIGTIINEQIANKGNIYIPLRDMVIDPIIKAYNYTLENPTADLLSQVTDTYRDNVRILGMVYDYSNNRIRLIVSRCKEEDLNNCKILDMSVIRFMDFDLDDDDFFTYTYVGLNNWNFGPLLKLAKLNNADFFDMINSSQSSYHGLLQVDICLNTLKESIAKGEPLDGICKGVCIEDQLFYDMDFNGDLKHYATVTSGEEAPMPEFILKEFIKGRKVTTASKVKKYVMELVV